MIQRSSSVRMGEGAKLATPVPPPPQHTDSGMLRNTAVLIPGSSLDAPHAALDRLDILNRRGSIARLMTREPTVSWGGWLLEDPVWPPDSPLHSPRTCVRAAALSKAQN